MSALAAMMPLGHVESEDGTCQSSVGVPRTGVTQGESRKLWLHRLMRDDPAALALFVNPEIKVTGRVCAVSEATRRRNPNLYPLPQVSLGPCKPPPTANKPPKRIRQSDKPRLNGLETEFLQRLKALYPSNVIRDQSIRFELSRGGWYKPDFIMFSPDGVIAYECKGPHAFRGGMENLKVAAHQYPEIRWLLVWKENGTWKEQVVLP